MANEINRSRPIPVIPNQILVAREVRHETVEKVGAIGSGDAESFRDAAKWLILLESRQSRTPAQLPTSAEANRQPAALFGEPATFQLAVPFNAVKNPNGSVQAGLEAVLKNRPALAKNERPANGERFFPPILVA